MKLRILIAAICFILPGLSYLSADIFRWTDKEGTVHFGNSVPPDAQDVKVVSKEISSGPAARALAPGARRKSTEASSRNSKTTCSASARPAGRPTR
jgi:hypothetical protein